MKIPIANTRNGFLFFMALSLMVTISCSPEDGVDGKDGIDGEQGAPGTPGNANVQSKIFEHSDITWIEVDDWAHISKEATLSFDGITQSVINEGAVLVYRRQGQSETWGAIPFSSYFGGVTTYYYFTTGIGNVKINLHNSTSTSPLIPGSDFRVIAIDGSLLSTMQEESVDLGNYEDLEKALKDM